MDEATKKLLEECSNGCKMAIQSMDQVQSYVEDNKLGQVISEYRKKHAELEDESEKMLEKAGIREKSPSPMATAYSWLTTEIKMKMKDDNHQIAKIMMNGCSMGIQTISEHRNQYCDASRESQALAEKLVKTEEAFMGDLAQFI